MRIPNIWDNQRYLHVLKCFLLGKPRIIGKFIRLDLFFLQDTAGSTANIEYIEYSLDSGRTTRILGKIIKSSSEMAKIARPVQEISEFLEQSLYYCTLIEKINKFLFFVVIFSKIKCSEESLHQSTSTIHCRFQISTIAGNWSNFQTIEHIVWWLYHMKLNYMYFFSVALAIQFNA